MSCKTRHGEAGHGGEERRKINGQRPFQFHCVSATRLDGGGMPPDGWLALLVQTHWLHRIVRMAWHDSVDGYDYDEVGADGGRLPIERPTAIVAPTSSPRPSAGFLRRVHESSEL